MFHSLRIRPIAFAVLTAILVVAPLSAPAKPHPTPTPSATPIPVPEDPAVTKIARREFVLWQAGNVDLENYSDSAKAQLAADKIATTSKELGQLGALVRSEWMYPIAFDGAPAGTKGYQYRMYCSNGAVYEQLVIDAQGKVTGILFRDKLEQ